MARSVLPALPGMRPGHKAALTSCQRVLLDEQDGAEMNRADLPAPGTGLVLTHFFTVRDVARSRAFYADVFDGEVVLEENPCIIKVANSWIIMNPGGGPTPDKPEVTLRPPEDPTIVSNFLNVRVADIWAFYEDRRARGVQFLTPPIDRRAELRCYIRDPDGYLIEIGEATGMLCGRANSDRPVRNP